MIGRYSPIVLLATVALGGCALRSDVRRLEGQLTTMQDDSEHRDSLLAAQLTQVLAMQRQAGDSLAAAQASLLAFRGETAGQFYEVQKQLLQVQELAGQSTRRLNELRGDLDARGQQLGGAAAPGGASSASAVQMYEASLQQLRRGSNATARAGFRQFLQQYPAATEAPDALYFIGESFSTEAPDSAAAYYTQVAEKYAASPRAASALYRLGAMAEAAKDTGAARDDYQRLVAKYPTSNEAALARDRLKALGQ